jgi:hypothetical protein
VEVVFARGTWEPPGVGVTGQAFIDALNVQRGGPPVAVYPVNYPATLDFPAAAAGIADASNHIEQTAANCPDTKIVLGGYSQGAAVAAYTTTENVPPGFVLPPGITGPMPPGIASHVAAVALFGLPDPWFLNLVDHQAPPITVGDLYTAKTIQLCARATPCASLAGSIGQPTALTRATAWQIKPRPSSSPLSRDPETASRRVALRRLLIRLRRSATGVPGGLGASQDLAFGVDSGLSGRGE